MLGLLAAAAHDVDHPGVNQPFLIKTNHHLANLYQVGELNTGPGTEWPTALDPVLEPESHPWRWLHSGSATVMTTVKEHGFEIGPGYPPKRIKLVYKDLQGIQFALKQI